MAVRITPDGCLVFSVDPDADVLAADTAKTVRLLSDEMLADVRDRASVQRLRAALAISEIQDYVCMCPGDLALEFLDEAGRRLTVVRIDSPGTVDWPLWKGKAVTSDRHALRTWLREQGADGPLVRAEERSKRLHSDHE